MKIRLFLEFELCIFITESLNYCDENSTWPVVDVLYRCKAAMMPYRCHVLLIALGPGAVALTLEDLVAVGLQVHARMLRRFAPTGLRC